MRSPLPTFRQSLKAAIAAFCLGGMLAVSQPARGQELFQQGGSRLLMPRTLPQEEPPAPGIDASSDPEPPHGGTFKADSDRTLLPSVGMAGDTLVIGSERGSHKIYIIGVEGKPGAMTVHFDDAPMQIFFDVQHIDVDIAGGSNFVAVYQVHVGGNVAISAGVDNELVLGRPTYDPNLIGGHLSVALGNGDNRVRLEESWVFGDATIGAGDGDNRVVLGRADSPSDLGAVILGDLFIATGAGPDRVEIAKCWLDGTVEVDTADGDDAVILGTHYDPASAVAGNVFIGTLVIATGSGLDAAGLTDNQVAGAVDIDLGDDDDALLVGAGKPANAFYEQVWAHGGAGQDSLDDDAANVYEFNPHFQSFELP